MKKSNFYFIIWFLVIPLIFIGCDDADSPTEPSETPSRGDFVEVTSKNTIQQSGVELFLNQIPEEQNINIQVKNDVELVSIVYKTVDYNGSLVDASGLIVVPSTNESHPLISLHHGTQTKSDNVGSQNPIYSFDAVIAGAIGYVAASPDYLGFGVSEGFHPYHHEETSASTSVDMLRAVRQYCSSNGIELNDQLFLAGYSQGGYVTMAVQKEIEQNLTGEFSITASAPMAGAYDLVLTANEILSNDTYERPSFISFLTYAFNEIYEWDDISNIFETPYDEKIPQLFDGSKTTAEIDDQLPTELSSLFTGGFLSNFSGDMENEVIQDLRSNNVLDWSPIAPIMLVHGNADNYVPYENALNAKEKLEQNGGEVTLVTIDGGTHETSVLPAIQNTINWFETFRNNTNNIVVKILPAEK